MLPRPAEHRDGSLADQALRAWIPQGAGRVAILTESSRGPGAGIPCDAVIAYIGVDEDPAAAVRAALTMAAPGATVVFVEPALRAGRSRVTGMIGRARRRRALGRVLAGRGLRFRRVVLVPSLDRPFLWFDDQAPPHIIRHAMGHFGFRQRQRALQSLSLVARDPLVGWWAPSLLHIVIAPPQLS